MLNPVEDAVIALMGFMVRKENATEFIQCLSIHTNIIDGVTELFHEGGMISELDNIFRDAFARPDEFPEFYFLYQALNDSCKEFASALRRDLEKAGLFVAQTCEREDRKSDVIFRMVLHMDKTVMKTQCVSFGNAATEDIRKYSLAMFEAERVWADLNSLMYCIVVESVCRNWIDTDGSAVHRTQKKSGSMVHTLVQCLPYLPRVREYPPNPMTFLKPVMASLVRQIVTAGRKLPRFKLMMRFHLNLIQGPTRLTFHHTPFPELQQVLINSNSQIDIDNHYKECISLLNKSWADFVFAVQQDLKGTGSAPASSSYEVTFELCWWNMVHKISRMEFGSDVTEPVRMQSRGRREEELIWTGLENFMYYFLAKAFQALDLNQELTNSTHSATHVPDGIYFFMNLNCHSHSAEFEYLLNCHSDEV